jgi:protocatechuate 3,4-dioxygenase beta subunit
VNANDVTGNQLINGVVPNPWTWTSVDTIGPTLANVSIEPAIPQEGQNVTISANVTDASGDVVVTITVTDPGGNLIVDNVTMLTGAGANEFYHMVPGSDADVAGTYDFAIWTNDSSGNLNSTNGSFNVTQEPNPYVVVRVTVTDASNTQLDGAAVEIRYANNGTIVATGLTHLGEYIVPLGAGSYTITASKSDYRASSEVLTLMGTELSTSISIMLKEEEEEGDIPWLLIFLATAILAVAILGAVLFLWAIRKKRIGDVAEGKPEEEEKIDERR